jgi:hypothetical protein
VPEKGAKMKKGYLEILNDLLKSQKYGFIRSPLPIFLIPLAMINLYLETLFFLILVFNYLIGDSKKDFNLFLGIVAYNLMLLNDTNIDYRFNKVIGE